MPCLLQLLLLRCSVRVALYLRHGLKPSTALSAKTAAQDVPYWKSPGAMHMQSVGPLERLLQLAAQQQRWG